MGFFKDAKQAVANARSGTVDLSQLTPEQRARYDANMAQVAKAQAESQQSWEQSQQIRTDELSRKVLKGPAGEYLYGPAQVGPSPQEMAAIEATGGARSVLSMALQQSRQQFSQAVDQATGRNLPPEAEDPQQRMQIAAHERAQRESLRLPYRAAHAQPVAIARIAMRGGEQLQTLIQKLGESGLAARPDLVYGVYRVPDRISPTLTPASERNRIVEWDIVHVPGALHPVTPQLMAAHFGASLQWVGRRRGEPEVIDEDLPLAYCTWAGIGPEHCLGIARFPEFRTWRQSGWTSGGSEEGPPMVSIVEGVYALHAPNANAGEIAERMMAGVPMQLPPESLPMAYVERLDWSEIASVVHPKRQRPPRIPSPFPYLPSTPQELLCAYLDVVGVQAPDCYSAQVTIDTVRQVQGSAGAGTVNFGPKLPCADGTPRQRIQMGETIVIAYRDRPEYEVGRQRWKAYQTDTLLADVDLRSTVRRPLHVHDNSDVRSPVLRAGLKVLDVMDRVYDAFEGYEQGHDIPSYRYCWPPVA